MADSEGASLYMTPQEAGTELRLGKRAVLEAVKRGTLPAARLSARCVRILRSDVEALATPGRRRR